MIVGLTDIVTVGTAVGGGSLMLLLPPPHPAIPAIKTKTRKVLRTNDTGIGFNPLIS